MVSFFTSSFLVVKGVANRGKVLFVYDKRSKGILSTKVLVKGMLYVSFVIVIVNREWD